MKKKSTPPTEGGRVCIVIATMLTIRLMAFGKVTRITDLSVQENTTYIIPESDTLIIKTLDMGNNTKLIINGTLRFEDNETSSDFVMHSEPSTKSFFTNYAWNWKQNLYIENNGKIECNNFTQSFSTINNMQATYTFNNNGAIVCEGDFYSDWVEDRYTMYISSCNAKIEAKNITFQGRAGWTYNGVYKTENFTIDITQGGTIIDIGSNCGTSKFNVQKLTLMHNVAQVNIEEVALLQSIDLSSMHTSINFHVDGILTEGYVWGHEKLLINGTDNSTISLCYNPTDGMDFQANGTAFATKSISSGRLIYLQNNDIANAWNTTSSPKTEKDIQGNPEEIGDRNSTYEQCLNGFFVSSLLPIELTSFTATGTENAISLEWEVASEKDLLNYSVEYSKNGIDWREIDVVAAMGTTSFATQYSSTVTNDFPFGFLYFRLKQVTFEGVEAYSNIITYDNTGSIESFKTLKVGPIDILYNNTERRYVEQ